MARTITLLGTAPGFVNLEVHSDAGALLARVTLDGGGDFSAPVDTTLFDNGGVTLSIDGWDVPAGQPANHHAQATLDLIVDNIWADGGLLAGTGPVAGRAQDLIDGFGINSHIGFADNGYQDLSSIATCVSYIGAPILRDDYYPPNEEPWFAQVAQTANVKFLLGSTTVPSALSDLRALSTTGWILGYEGPNEVDDQGAAVPPQQAAAYMPSLWQAGQEDFFPVFNLSFGNVADYGTLGDLSQDVTYGNAHPYAPDAPNLGGPYGTGYIDWFRGLSRMAAPNRPVAITEFGYQEYPAGQPQSGYEVVSPTTKAAYFLDYVFDAWNWGSPYYFIYELLDDPGAAWGLFDSSFNPRPSATALGNLFTLLADPGSDATTFTPAELSYTLTGLPSGSNPYTGGQQALFQKSDGSFWLALWNEQELNDQGNNNADVAVADVAVGLQLGNPASLVTVYDPMTGVAPVQTASNTATVELMLPAHPILVEIQ